MNIRATASLSPDKSRTRHDGWTAERQLRFLEVLARTGSVTRAAGSVGMSRESAYRLRRRSSGALFAMLWDRVIEGHNRVNFAPPLRTPRLQKSPGNAPKMTKWRKWKDPRLHPVSPSLL